MSYQRVVPAHAPDFLSRGRIEQDNAAIKITIGGDEFAIFRDNHIARPVSVNDKAGQELAIADIPEMDNKRALRLWGIARRDAGGR
jgi:hypothetical protein